MMCGGCLFDESDLLKPEHEKTCSIGFDYDLPYDLDATIYDFRDHHASRFTRANRNRQWECGMARPPHSKFEWRIILCIRVRANGDDARAEQPKP